jgi:DNA-binding transcriptional MerR regulator
VSSRTYLSIGDVLTLLREEFPDVTISKIRFLESQGLVNPERSPSGYRKFFDHDVERLRWVLRQQREHFLPLKVIRDRLADGELDDVPDGSNGKSVSGAGAASPAQAAGQHAPAHALARDDEQPTKADEEAMARILADASRRAARLPEHAAAPGARDRDLRVVEDPVVAGATGATAQAAAATPAGEHRPAHAASSGRHVADASRPEGGRPAEPATGRGASEAAPGRRASGGESSGRTSAGRAGSAGASGATAAPPAAPLPTTSPMTTSVVTGASMTAEELCAACGLSGDELAGLEGFGLIESVTVAGLATYDEDALTVANLAASFRGFGIEPRHLRLFRNAADRELGLIEQVVIPLLRQRNPEARQRAGEASEQLAALGQSMRAALLRQALRRHLGG